MWTDQRIFNILHARIQKVCSEGVQRCQLFFLVDERIQIHVPLKAKHHGPTSETPFKRATDGPTLIAGLEAL